MTREEVVKSREYIFAKEACKHGDQDEIQAFEEGAEYGYQYAIEKACEWLNIFYNEETHSYLIKEDIEQFIKAME